jgi:hypothetical protein
MTHTRCSKRWPVSVAATTIALAAAGCGAARTEAIRPAPAAHVTTDSSRATRLHEYRQLIIGLYRVRGSELPGEKPLDTLRRSLATQYGQGVPSRRV